MNNNRVHTLKPECSIPIANRGGVPHYPKSEGLQERLARCIEHELYYGGNHEAAAAAIIRDVNLGYIKQLTSSDTAPISLNDRLPGPEDCNKQNMVWVYEGKYCPSYYTEPWKLTELPQKELGEDFSNAYFWRNVTHWLPYNAIPIPKTTDET